MSLRSKLADAIAGRGRQTAVQEKSNQLTVNALCSAYENLFAQVRPIVNEMKKVIPYAVTDRGTRVTNPRKTEELTALMSPNDDMSYLDFMDTVLVAWLTTSEVNIHVHRDDRGRVFGYSILPSGCRVPAFAWGGEVDKFVFRDGLELKTLYPDEVMTIRFSRSPLDYDKGVSPAEAVFVWSQIDDLMAQYQKAYLENGAVPAHITLIRASTRDKYEKKRHDLESGLSGAKNKNKTIYIWRQTLDDGSEADEVEVKTIQGNNATLAIKELISVVDDRLNKAFGVSNFILGNDSSAKYDNAEQTMLRFAENVVYPALVDFWDKFQHELDRITGGLGYAITFDMAIPELTDRAKVKAETKDRQADSLIKLIDKGASATGALIALNLGEEWLGAASAMVKRADDDRAAAQMKSIAYDPLLMDKNNHHCHSCDQVQPEKTTDANYLPLFGANEELEKKIYDALMELAEEIAAENPNLSEDAVKAQIIEALTEEGNRGSRAGARRIAALLGTNSEIKKELLQQIRDNGFEVSAGFEERLRKRVDLLVKNFEDTTKQAVAEVLANTGEGKTAGQIKRELSEVLPRRRAELIARNEVGHSFQNARLETDEIIANRYGLKVKLVWRAHLDSRTCDVCAAMDGSETYLGTAFADSAIDKNGQVVGWQQTSWNDYGREPNAHVNCRCTFDEEFE